MRSPTSGRATGRSPHQATPSRCTTSGVASSTAEEFDASWNRGEPLEFRLGVGQVIRGWDQGVQGMKVGDRRKLVIPPDLGYGSRGVGSAIKPNETLIFVCDLISA